MLIVDVEIIFYFIMFIKIIDFFQLTFKIACQIVSNICIYMILDLYYCFSNKIVMNKKVINSNSCIPAVMLIAIIRFYSLNIYV